MTARNVRRILGVALMVTLCAGSAMTLDLSVLSDATNTVAARYHLRTRTSNFYQRASSQRSTGVSRGIFRR